jgi:energy-coupling factor transporter transmembrane protein EcfT
LSARDVREWISSGRADGNTLARGADESKWRPLPNFVEFAAALETSASSSATPQDPPKTHRLLAIMSLVLSVVPLCFLPGLILGIVTLVLVKKKPQHFGGKRLAIAAIIIGLLWPIGFVTAGYTAFLRQRAMMYQGGGCHMHVRSLASSLRVISYANKGIYPEASQWSDAIRREVTSTNHFQCPNDTSGAQCSYAYNEKVAGRKDLQPDTVVIFEADLGWNGSGGISNVVAKARHGPMVMIGFANSNVRPVHTNELRRLRWNP